MATHLLALFEPGGLLDWNGPLMSSAVYAVGILAVSRLFFDTYYFLTVYLFGGYIFIKYHLGLMSKRKGLLEESVITTRCWTTDLDYMFHMNNSRYNRVCDFARYNLLTENYFYWILRKHNTTFGLAATTIRFRRSVNFFESAIIKSKIVYWDERAFYVEQNFHRPSDSFVYATVYAKLTLVGTTSDQFLGWYGYTGPMPELNKDLKSWIHYCEQSSERLRPKSS